MLVGLTENILKDRFYKHKKSFKHESKKVLELKFKLYVGLDRKKSRTSVSLKHVNIVDKVKPYIPCSGKSIFFFITLLYVIYINI